MNKLITLMFCAVTIQSAYTHDGDDAPCRTNARRSPSGSTTSYNNAWLKIKAFMEANGFEHSQYSGYESIHGMSYADAFSVLERLQETFPWFRECAKAASLTEIGKRHDVLEHLDHIKDEVEPQNEPEPHVSLQSEMKVMREAARALESNSGRNQGPQVKNNER